ncbi:MAG: autotransporter domain-containing protein [Parvibaculum sp.]|nr:autotransporter domain-containing protein [Parvibaculum sp.]
MTKRIRRNNAGKQQHIDNGLIGSAYSYYGGVVRTSGEAKTPHGLKRVFAAALLSGASILAVGVAATGSAKAGTCTSIGTTVICTGAFEESVQYTGVEDLTVTLGAGSVIDTTDESSEADFDNAGILVTGEGNVSVTNNGSIITGDEGYYIEEFGPYYGGDRHHGIAAYSDEGTARVTNSAQGTIVTTSEHSHGAIAVSGFEEFWGGDAYAVNHGLIGTEGDYSYGLVAVAKYTASADNSGGIVTDGEGSVGIYAYSKYESIVVNSGSVETWGENADGIVAISGGSVSVTNSGSVETYGDESSGIVASIDWEMSEYSEANSITVDNSGSIETWGSESHGISASAPEGSVEVSNSGTIDTSGEESYGVSLWGYSVSLDNSGSIVTTGESSHAVVAHSGGDDTTTIVNTGFIGAYGEESDAIVASGPTVRIHNNFVEGEEGEDDVTGIILSEDGAAIRIEESGDARIYNGGNIYGNVAVEADEYGYLLNDGLIESDRRWRAAVSIDVDEGNAVVENNGTIRATGRDAEAVKLEGYSVSLTNSGDITASGKRGHAVDLEAEGTYGHATLTNSGLIEASGENADAIRAEGHRVVITNQAVAGEGEEETVHGIIRSGERAAIRVDESDYVYVVNNGFIYGNVSIEAEKYASVITGENSLILSERRNVAAVGIEVDEGDAYVLNDGAIVTTKSRAKGIEVDVWEGDAYVRNNGSVTTGSLDEEGDPDKGWRSHAIDVYAEHDATVINTGDVTAYGNKARGIRVTTDTGAALGFSSGTVETWGANGTGIYAQARGRDSFYNEEYEYTYYYAGDALAGNSGDVVTRGDYAFGVAAVSGYGYAGALNILGGSIVTSGDGAIGLVAAAGYESLHDGEEGGYSNEDGGHAFAVNGLPPIVAEYGLSEFYFGFSGGFGNVSEAIAGLHDLEGMAPADFRSTIVTTGDAAHGVAAMSSQGHAFAANFYGTVTTGSLDEEGDPLSGHYALGVAAWSSEGDAWAMNKYDGQITTYGHHATALAAHAGDDAFAANMLRSSIVTHGDYSTGVLASSDYGEALAFNKYNSSIVTHGDYSAGLVAHAEGTYYYDGEGWVWFGGDAVTVNSGSTIQTHGDYSTGMSATSGRGDAYAYNLNATNEEDETIEASIVTHGDGSTGIYVRAWEGMATAVNSGSIVTHGKYASGIEAHGETVHVANSGAISTEGKYSHGIEASSNSPATTTVVNSGSIEVTGDGAHGILASGPTVNITNTEDGYISSAYGDAIHVFDSKYVSIVNHGDIRGDVVVAENEFYGEYAPQVYVLHTGYIDGNITTAAAESDDTIIVDGGRITGAIFTGDGTDEVTVQGEGVELGKGIHAGGEGEAHLTFAHDDEIVLDDGIEGWAVSGFNTVDFDSGRAVLDGYGIHTAGEEGAVNVAYGATLATTGEGAHVAAAEVNIDGTLDIGFGGFFDVTGDVSFAGDSTFFTRVQHTTAGVVSGNTVTFAEGATIFADVTGGIEASVGEDILVASAYEEDGVTDYGAVVKDNIFLFRFAKVMNGDITETGSADELFLRVQIEETAFDTAEDARYTKNQLSIADALDVYLRTQPLSSPLVKWLAQFETEEEQREELLKVIKDTLPEESNGSGTATIVSTDLIYDMIMDRLSGGGFAVAQNGDTGVSAGDTPLGGDGNWAIWGRAGASRAKFTPGSVNGFDADSWGVTVGIDGEIAPNTRIGFGAFYLASDVEENGAGANATNDITGYGATAYMSYRPSAWYLNAALGFGTNEYDSRRLSLGGVNVANYDGTQFVARAEVGHMFTSGQWDVTPSVGLRYNRVDMDAYTETGPLPISVDSQTVESLRAVAGVNARYSFLLESGAKLIPEFGVKILGELADPDQAITGSVVGGGAFTVQSVPRDDVSFGLGAGVTWEVSDRFSLRVTYDGELQSDYDEHALAAAVRFAF